MTKEGTGAGGLTPPPTPMLARIPDTPPELLAGPELAAELKWDGFRCLAFRSDRGARLLSRHDRPLGRYFPEVGAAVEAQLPPRTVADGELIVWRGDRVDFTALRERIHPAESRVRELAARMPARLVLFDLLQLRGVDLRSAPYRFRRQELERLGEGLRGNLAVTPATTDPEEAARWWDTYVSADVGIEGLMLKSTRGRYRGGSREWLKLRRRITAEAVVGGITGSRAEPRALILGLPEGDRLRMVGMTGPLPAAERGAIGEAVRPTEEHPWPGRIRMFGDRSGESRSYLRVVPELIAEVAADPVREAGRWRHPVRYLRLRPDLEPEDLRVSDRSGGSSP